MNKVFERLSNFRPRMLPSAMAALIAIGATMDLLTSGRSESYPPLLVCLLYAAAFISLCLVVWAFVRLMKSIDPKRRVSDKLHQSALTARLADDHAYRIRMTGYASLVLNVLLALSKAVAGWYSSSDWLIVLAAYYAVLCLTRFWVLERTRRADAEADERVRLRKEWQTFRICGLLLIVLTAVLQGVVIKIVKDDSAFSYQGTLIFVAAMYDFYCLISAIVYMVKTRGKHTPATVAVKAISLATSLVAMLSLQTAMFASFGAQGGTDRTGRQLMNTVTGSAVCVLLLATGIIMVVQSAKKLAASA